MSARLFIALLFSTGLASSACVQAEARNVIVIAPDDWGVDKFGFADTAGWSTAGPTPVMDSMAQAPDGMYFRRAWASPSCSPWRGSFLTGTYSERHGMGRVVSELGRNPSRLHGLDAAVPNIASMLRAQGVHTVLIGKWHMSSRRLGLQGQLSHPQDSGFVHADQLAGNTSTSISGLPVSGYYAWERIVQGVPTLVSAKQAGRFDPSKYTTVVQAEEVIRHLGDPSPWFIYFAPNDPHIPNDPPPSDLRDFAEVGRPNGACDDPAPQCPMAASSAKLGSTCGTDPDFCYLAKVQALDTLIGRIIHHPDFDKSTTTVIIMGDNGTPNERADGPFPKNHNKTTVYEGGVNVPLIVYGRGVGEAVRGTISDALVSVVDLCPTILALMGVELVPGACADSVSMMPYLRGEAVKDGSLRDHLYASRFQPNGGPPNPAVEYVRAARTADYKLIRQGRCGRSRNDEFYFLDPDGWEKDPSKLESSPLPIHQLTGRAKADYQLLDVAVDRVARETTPAIEGCGPE